jgi:hypothetical protein
MYHFLFMIGGTLLRFFLMLLATLLLAYPLEYCFNQMEFDRCINFWQAWMALTIVGIARFAWHTEELL